MIQRKWKKIWEIVHKVRGRLVAAGIFQFLQIALSFFLIFLTQTITDDAAGQKKDEFFALLPWLLCVMIAEACCFWLHEEMMAGCKNGFAENIKKQLTQKQLNAQFSDIREKTAAEWVNIYQNYIDPLAESFQNNIIAALYPIQILCAVVYYIRISWKLLAAALILIPFSSVLYKKLSVPVQRQQRRILEQKGVISSFVKDVMKGFHTMKSYQLEPFFAEMYEEKINEQVRLEKVQDRIQMQLGRVFIILQYIPQLVIPLYGGYLAFHGEITVGQLLASGSMVSMIVIPVESLLDIMKTGRAIEPAGEEIERILNWEETKSATGENTLRIERKEKEDFEEPMLEIRDLTFGYCDATPVFEHTGLRVKRGEHVILLGKSGCGKSTLIHLILGFYPVCHGEIRIDHFKVGAETEKSIHQIVSYVPQHPYIFQGTVAENIAMGKNYSREEIEEAAKAAQADAFIRQLPDGYDTEIGKGILNVSGGQSQRIGIARGIVKKSELFILDEPTSALDPKGEQELVSELKDILVNKTSIIITHREAVIGKEDRVLYLRGGKIVEA